MQPSEKLARVLRDLVALVEEEAEKNPSFAERLEAITSSLPTRGKKDGARNSQTAEPVDVPDVFAILKERGIEEFGYWLRTLNLTVLKAIVKQNGFDPARVGARWTDPDKFATLIAEQAQARLKRGSAFLPPPASEQPN